MLPCNCMDYVVTEYGIAQLKGKTLRQRTRELIAMAYPDFRAELKKEAQELSWPWQDSYSNLNSKLENKL